MKECHIYIETSLRWPKKGSGIVGLVFTDQAEKNTRQLFGQVNDSNEYHSILVGIMNALNYCSSFDLIKIHLSCRNVASGFNWLPSWKQNDFKNSKGEPVKYAADWQAIAAASEKKRIEIDLGFNGYRNWLKSECDSRGRKHGYIL